MGDNQEFSSQNMFKYISEAAVASGSFINQRIVLGEDISKLVEKNDKTFVSDTDIESQARGAEVLLKGFPSAESNFEESETVKSNAQYTIHFDPLDGTGGFLNGGPTPTVIIGIYDNLKQEWKATGTLEASTGRFWYSEKGAGTHLNRYDFSKEAWQLQSPKELAVRKDINLGEGIVLVDVTHGFKRALSDGSKKEMLTPEGRAYLGLELETNYNTKTGTFHSNGTHYALTSMGRPQLVGNITTAIGGSFDHAGVLHVLESGGVAASMEIHGEGTNRYHSMNNPHMIGDKVDIIYAAANQQTLDTMTQIISRSLTR